MLVIRRVNLPNGDFLGLVVGLIDIQYLEIFLPDDRHAARRGRSTLLRRDGTVIASQPAIDGSRGRRMPNPDAVVRTGREGRQFPTSRLAILIIFDGSSPCIRCATTRSWWM